MTQGKKSKWLAMGIAVAMQTLSNAGMSVAQNDGERMDAMDQKLQTMEEASKYKPQVHGILRGKYEYQPDLESSRFEVRNARLSVSGKMAQMSEYKLEVDLCDESAIKMKDAWVRVNPCGTLRLSMGQQRMPFSIDAHRNPSAQFFANRSFIAKQVGDMRDVGFMAGVDITDSKGRKMLLLDAGLFNGSNLDNQKSAWFKKPGYSARVQYYPLRGLALIPSIQHQQIAERQASYTSVDMGAYFETGGWHIEAEYLHKMYAHNAFEDCNAMNAMVIYGQKLRNESRFFERISYIGRFDWMEAHTSGKSGFAKDANGNASSTLMQTDAERRRMTLGATFSLKNKHFPSDIRLNYEKYWYPQGGAKESEQDKLVCEVMIRF